MVAAPFQAVPSWVQQNKAWPPYAHWHGPFPGLVPAGMRFHGSEHLYSGFFKRFSSGFSAATNLPCKTLPGTVACDNSVLSIAGTHKPIHCDEVVILECLNLINENTTGTINFTLTPDLRLFSSALHSSFKRLNILLQK